MPAALTLPVDTQTLARVDALAARREVSRETIMREALSIYLDEEGPSGDLAPWQREQIEAGLAAAERGDLASEEEVERVFAKFRG